MHKEDFNLISLQQWSRNCGRIYKYLRTGAISGTWTTYPSGTSEHTSGFSRVSVVRYLVFCVVVCGSLFALLSVLILFWLPLLKSSNVS
jgi:hypothetical protein